jgi:hypothetical protein
MNKAAVIIKSLPIEKLILSFELTESNNDENIPTVRGWLMDELEERNPEAFEKWLDSCEASPRRFFL